MAKSKLKSPCWRRLESTRGSFPKVKAFGCEKHEVLNHSFSLDSALPENSALQPGTRFGRAPAPNKTVGLKVKNFRGKPLCSVGILSPPHPHNISPTPPQPDTIFPTGPLTPEKNFLPLPNGRSRT